jgi:hypothetical protein
MAHLLHFFSAFLIDLVPRPLHPRALVVGLSLGKTTSRPLHVELTEAEEGIVAMGRVQFEGAAETSIRSWWYQGGNNSGSGLIKHNYKRQKVSVSSSTSSSAITC